MTPILTCYQFNVLSEGRICLNNGKENKYSLFNEAQCDTLVVLFACEMQRGLSVKVDQVDVGAVGDQSLDDVLIPGRSGHMKDSVVIVSTGEVHQLHHVHLARSLGN